jgi:hypothetical protein
MTETASDMPRVLDGVLDIYIEALEAGNETIIFDDDTLLDLLHALTELRERRAVDARKESEDMTETTAAETRTPPPPTFPHHVYGVNLTFIGEDGGIMAEGHVPLVRFVAACNHMARNEFGHRNLLDYSEATLGEALEGVRQCWALPADEPDGEDCDWYVRHNADVTAGTPGAIPVTLWEP